MHLPLLDIPWQLRALSTGQRYALYGIARSFGDWHRFALLENHIL